MKNNLMAILKQYRIIISLIICGVILIPIIVHLFFSWEAKNDFFKAKWTAGELLEYIAAILSFLGTIILSILALYSSQKANAISQKVTDIEQSKYMLELRPFVLVTDWKVYELTSKEIMFRPQKKYIQIGDYNDQEALGLSLTLTNTTESFVSVQYSKGKTSDAEWKNAAVNQSNLKMVLAPNSSDEFVFYATKDDLKRLTSSSVEIELYLENRFSHRYKEHFTIIVTPLSYLPSSTETKWFCTVYAQNYSVFKFAKNKDGATEMIPEEL